MRLINVDDLIIEILTHDLIGDDKGVDKMILDAPIIDAIPVEWLKKWAADNSNGEWSIEYRTVFNGILKDWKKENGIEKSTRNI